MRDKRLIEKNTLLLVFLFCGAVIGETVSLSLIVTALGPLIIGKLYLVNAAVLLLLPIIFFQAIDTINRGELFSNILLGTIVIVALITIIIVVGDKCGAQIQGAFILLYPVAYLSKTILFLTYWTLLNDIFSINQAKKKFPVIAAWGFIGAIAGVIIAKGILFFANIYSLLLLWVIVYVLAWYLSRKIDFKTKKQLFPVEAIPDMKRTFFGASDLLASKLVRIMSLFYFLTFFAVFIVDVLFWQSCYRWYKTSEAVASFQFTFYLSHAVVTVILLRYSLPSVIRKVGFTYIMYALPIVFFIGGMVVFSTGKSELKSVAFLGLVSVQFLRYLLFELTFAPSYQMFFAAIVKEHRGRAKTFLEGVIKPFAILSSGIVLVLSSNLNTWLYVLISFIGICLCVVINYLRRTYGETVVKDAVAPLGISEVIDEAGLVEDDDVYIIVKGYASSKETDLRTVAIHLLQRIGTAPALEQLEMIYEREKEVRVKQSIARNLTTFYTYKAKGFIEKLLKEGDSRIRSNTIHAVNEIRCNWKKHLKDIIAPMLFEDNLRIQVETARFLWSEGNSYDKSSVRFFIRKLLESSNNQRVSAALYLIGEIGNTGWEERVSQYLKAKSFQVFSRAADMLMKNGSSTGRHRTLSLVEQLDRRHITYMGKTICNVGATMVEPVMVFLPKIKKKRMFYEMVLCLWKISDFDHLKKKTGFPDENTRKKLNQWIHKELLHAYRCVNLFIRVRKIDSDLELGIMDLAVRENLIRLCEWIVRTIGILQYNGSVIWSHKEFNLHNEDQRNEIIEALESMPGDRIITALLPLLKEEEWVVLAKIGELEFQITTGRNESFCTILESENRFIVLSALYTLRKYPEVYFSKEVEAQLLQLLQNKNRIVRSATMDVLSSVRGNRIERSKALELLDGVLLLKKTAIFKNISAEKLLRLVEITHLVEFQKNEIVSKAGKVADQLYIVKEGALRIVKGDEASGEQISYVGVGESYGEIGLLSKSVRKITAVADKRSIIYIVKNADLKRLIRELPDIGFNLLESISIRLLQVTGGAEGVLHDSGQEGYVI